MKVDQKYRFKLLNLCDFSASYSATGLSQLIVTVITIGAHDFAVGDYAFFEGFAPAIPGYQTLNGYSQVVEVSPTAIAVLIPGLVNLSSSTSPTVKRLNAQTVNPLNFYDTTFKWEQEKEEIFFRQLLSGLLKFTSADYRYFLEHILPNECCEVKLLVEKKCSNLGIDGLRTEQNWNVYWQGYFAHNSCDWNLSHCEVTVEVETDDAYRCLLYGMDDKQTIFETLTYFERLECCKENVNLIAQGGSSCSPPCVGLLDALYDGGDDVVGFDNAQKIMPCDDSEFNEWQIEKHQTTQTTFTNEPVERFKICVTYIREVAITIDNSDGTPVEPSGINWVMRNTLIYNGLPAHKWTRLPYGGIYYVFSSYTVVRDCAGLPCTRTWTVNFPDSPDSTNTQKYLGDVANQLSKANCNQIGGFRSDFFEINAPGDTPGYVAGTNYVTGLPSTVNNLRLQQLSAYLTITTGTLDEITSDITLKEFLDSLKLMFNCKWFVDEAGYIRMEHISWFRRTVNVDTMDSYENKLYNKSKKHFKYDRTEIPLREQFESPYAGYKDFIGVDIKYNGACVNLRKTVKYVVPKFSADLKYIREKGSDIKDFNSFLLLACDSSNDVITETGILTATDQLNGPLSWANLHDAYYRHDRYLIAGNMNEMDTTFETAKKFKRQVPLIYTAGNCCKAIDPLYDLVSSELGDGQIDKLEKSNRTECFTIQLLF